MSVIAAKVECNKITIASDSILIQEDLKRTDFKKLHRTADVIVGSCGTAEELCLFFAYVDTHSPKFATTSGIMTFMSEFAKWKCQYINDSEIHNCYLIIFKNKLFEVDGLFVREIHDYTAIGEGEPYALTALHLGHNVVAAVRAACELCCFVSEPILTYEITV